MKKKNICKSSSRISLFIFSSKTRKNLLKLKSWSPHFIIMTLMRFKIFWHKSTACMYLFDTRQDSKERKEEKKIVGRDENGEENLYCGNCRWIISSYISFHVEGKGEMGRKIVSLKIKKKKEEKKKLLSPFIV